MKIVTMTPEQCIAAFVSPPEPPEPRTLKEWMERVWNDKGVYDAHHHRVYMPERFS
jgi:hypothetical protein